jgi:hypothetical protein
VGRSKAEKEWHSASDNINPNLSLRQEIRIPYVMISAYANANGWFRYTLARQQGPEAKDHAYQ